MDTSSHQYDIAIIGGGASGAALLYALAKYTNIQRIALIEKYDRPGQVNSKATNNSQTLHVGDIETNYSIDKVRQVKPASLMLKYYTDGLSPAEREAIIFPTGKMVLGVGASDIATLTKRFDDIRGVFPDLQLLDREAIAQIEPEVMRGRDPKEPVIALYTEQGYAVNFEALATSFVTHAQPLNPLIDVLYDSAVETIKKTVQGYTIAIKNKPAISAAMVVVDADSYSLFFAKQLGYGKQYSLIPIAGTFYFSKPLLNGKVYTVQEPKLPFAAVHGDPDIVVKEKTRWGPTARFHPVLESRNASTSVDYIKSSGLHRPRTWQSFIKILLDPIRLKYLVENMLYELPYVGDLMFLKNVRKIIPAIKISDIEKAKGFGGMRLQRVDTSTHELQLGEGKIIGHNIIFNMTPSPGASVSLYNAMRDIEQIVKFSGNDVTFDKARFCSDLTHDPVSETISPSIDSSYAS